MRGLLLSTVFPVSVLLSGCVTTQGGGLVGVSDSFLKPLGMDTSTVTDSFSAEMRAVRQSVEAGKLEEAEASILKDLEFFRKRFADETKPLPSYMQTLGEHVWRKHYSQRVKTATEELSAIENVLEPTNWARQSQSLQNAKRLEDALRQDAVVGLLRQGIDERQKLQQELQRIVELAKTSRPKAVALSYADVLASGKYSYEFPAGPFVAADYVADPEFQAAAQQELLRQPTPAALSKKALDLSDFLSEQTRSAVDQQFAELIRRELLADSKVTLEEMTNLAGLRTPFNGANEKLTSVVRVGYVDLTSANLRNRSIFDFEVAFKQDLSLTFVPADETIFRSGDWSGYDYLFVTELAAAKVTRDFKSRAPVKSRAKVGERQEPNPGYVSAMTSYQQAMAEFQRAQISAAVPKACQGWGCVLQGLADGLSEGSARQRVDSASKALASTSQYLTVPVYADYNYESVDINTAKFADVNYFVIDVKGRRILRSNFQINDQEKFNVAYNLRDEDPDKNSILRNVKSEEEVTGWEKRPVEVPLSALFSAKNLLSARSTPLTDVSSFVASLNSKQAVAASPNYARGDSKSASVASRGVDAGGRAAGGNADTIADARFDSVVVIRAGNSLGTGFYVTPELILTAHHVVDKNSLTQLVFYNGTKSYGRVVDHDVRLDLALIRAQTPGKPLKIHTGPLRLGETVEAIGHPKGFEFTITRGVVSALRRQRSATLGSNIEVEFVQTDTPISPGNSGGPLLLGDSVIGVNDWIRVDKGSQNLNFSVSFNEIREFLNRTQVK